MPDDPRDPIDPVPPAEVPVGLGAFAAAMDDRDKLFDIIDRAAEALPSGRMMDRLNGMVYEVEQRHARFLSEVIDGLNSAREILAEADPEGPSEGGGEGVGGG